MFAHMKKQDQQMWLEQVPCDNAQYNGGSPVYGFSAVAKGDYVNYNYELSYKIIIIPLNSTFDLNILF